MTPYYADDACTIYHAEAATVIATLPAASVDALVTDPPYSSGGQFRGDRVQAPTVKYIRDESDNQTLGEFTGDNRDQLGWLAWVSAWLHATLRVVKPGGIAALFCDWRQLPAACLALQAGGYVWRGVVPWHKPNARPTQGRWSNACEYVVWGTNGPRSLDALDGSALPGFFTAHPPREREHITQKPLSVMVELLAIVPEGSLVLDPFAGSGTTLRAAKDTGRRAIGIEIEERYCRVAMRRLGQEVLPVGPGAVE